MGELNRHVSALCAEVFLVELQGISNRNTWPSRDEDGILLRCDYSGDSRMHIVSRHDRHDIIGLQCRRLPWTSDRKEAGDTGEGGQEGSARQAVRRRLSRSCALYLHAKRIWPDIDLLSSQLCNVARPGTATACRHRGPRPGSAERSGITSRRDGAARMRRTAQTIRIFFVPFREMARCVALVRMAPGVLPSSFAIAFTSTCFAANRFSCLSSSRVQRPFDRSRSITTTPFALHSNHSMPTVRAGPCPTGRCGTAGRNRFGERAICCPTAAPPHA
jgi:hypothetical protein